MLARFSHSLVQSPQIISFIFKTESAIDYTAGQFIELALPHPEPDAKGIRRWFTLSSSPTEPDIAITVKFSQPGSSFKHALQALQAGDEVHISDPLGDFVMPLDSNLPLVWLAGGIGITPFRSMATWLADNRETRNINFFQSISQPEDAIFEDVLIAAGINQRQRIASSGTHASRLDAAMVLRSVADPTAAYYYLAGPEAMVAALATELLAADIPRHQIISDIFLGYR